MVYLQTTVHTACHLLLKVDGAGMRLTYLVTVHNIFTGIFVGKNVDAFTPHQLDQSLGQNPLVQKSL